MRLFIAVNPPVSLQDALKNSLEPAMEAARISQAKVRWVRPDQYHVTIRFLGEFPSDRRARLQDVLREALEKTPVFSLAFQGFVCLPLRGMPHTIAMRIHEGQESLQTLAEQTGLALERLDIQKENRLFQAHVTVGRLRFMRDGKQLRSLLENIASPPVGPFSVLSVDLMQSILHPAGPDYSCLHQISLAPAVL